MNKTISTVLGMAIFVVACFVLANALTLGLLGFVIGALLFGDSAITLVVGGVGLVVSVSLLAIANM